MPHANIWIRKENEEAWNAIADKSAWLNGQLSGKFVVATPVPEPIKPTTKMLYCKNGHIIPGSRDKCTFKGCKYA